MVTDWFCSRILRRICGESAQVARSDQKFECIWLESHSEVAFGINQTWKLSKAQNGRLRTLQRISFWQYVETKMCCFKRLTIDQLGCCYQKKPRGRHANIQPLKLWSSKALQIKSKYWFLHCFTKGFYILCCGGIINLVQVLLLYWATGTLSLKLPVRLLKSSIWPNIVICTYSG